MSFARSAIATFGCCLLSGCLLRGCESSRPPIHPNPNMDDQPRYEAQEASPLFHDGKTMREPIPGTIARGELVADPVVETGKEGEGAFVAEIPMPVDDALLERGKERFGIYCTPCHDRRGEGQGILTERGGVPVPSLHIDRIRAYSPGRVFDVISNGSGLMPSYRYPIPPADRWAIVAHVGRLQAESSGRAAR